VRQSVLSLTLEEVITLAVSIAASIIAIISAVIVWIKTPRDERTLSTLDEAVAAKVGAVSDNPAVMSSFENIVSGLSMTWQEMLKDSNQTVLQAAQWIPGETSNALADIYTEATDGVPLEKKLEGQLTRIEQSLSKMLIEGEQANHEPGFLQDYDAETPNDDTQPIE
jgi:hypothetical protein